MEGKEAPSTNARRVETDPETLQSAMLRIVDRRLISRGEIVFPCVPSLLEAYVDKLSRLWDLLGRRSSEEELSEARRIIQKALVQGYELSPHTVLLIQYEAHSRQPLPQLSYVVGLQERSLDSYYSEVLEREKGALFGKTPDSKVMLVAAELGNPDTAPILDVGAGTGRNAIALARRGHPVTAVELVSSLCEEMRRSVNQERLSLNLVQGDVLSPDVLLDPGHYKLAILTEVLSDFGRVADVERAFEKLSDAVAPGGLLLFNAFLPRGGYTPDAVARQISHAALSSVFTRDDLRFITDKLPFEQVSDESAHDFEQSNQPAESWPPTSWFVSWSQGRNVFDLRPEETPIELRWLLYRKKR